MKRPTWALVTGIIAIIFGVMNGWNAMVDLSQVQSWKAMNALFAPAQQLIQDQGAEAANFAFGIIAPPAWFVNFAAQASWAGIMLGVLFAAAGVGLLLFRKAGMWLLGIALALNIILQGIYSMQAVRTMSVQVIAIPSRAIWVIVLNLLVLLVIGIGSLRWFRFARPVTAQS
jgi:hypothetical protein